MKLAWRDIGVGLLAPATLVLVWHFVTYHGWVNPQALPSPEAVARKWVEYLLPLQP